MCVIGRRRGSGAGSGAAVAARFLCRFAVRGWRSTLVTPGYWPMPLRGMNDRSGRACRRRVKSG